MTGGGETLIGFIHRNPYSVVKRYSGFIRVNSERVALLRTPSLHTYFHLTSGLRRVSARCTAFNPAPKHDLTRSHPGLQLGEILILK
jgi:hypothetical protein